MKKSRLPLFSFVLLTLVAAAHAQSVTVVEYHNTALDAYFITGRPTEQALLDASTSFTRTGMSFAATTIAAAGNSQGRFCRFYVSVVSPFVSSHYYGGQSAVRQAYDCEALIKAAPSGFSFEGYDFAALLPENGVCPTGTSTVYRGFRALTEPNNGKTSNHRYSVSSASYAAAIAAGYVGEGAQFCVSEATPAALSYATPANFAARVNSSYTPTSAISATSTVTNRARYMVSDASSAGTTSNYLSIGSAYSDSATAGYTVAAATLSASSTYDDYLNKTIQFVKAADGNYRLDSHLHPNNSIDVDAATSSLKFRNVFGKTSATANGYVTFSYDASTHLLKAQNRYDYRYASSTASTPFAATYTQDSTFTGSGKYVNITNGNYTLASTGTPLYLYPTPLNLGIPTFMNPLGVTMVSNDTAPFISKVVISESEGTTGQIYKNVKAAYRGQISSPGTNAATRTAAMAQLATIVSTIQASGQSLRYAPAVYMAFRDAALATKLVSDSISDGTPGQNLVPYVYFTNEQDSAGKYHPFMIVVNYGNPASPNGLKDIPRPPGQGSGNYGSSKVTRYSNLDNYVTAIPMKDYGQVTAVTDNNYSRTLWSDVTNTQKSKNVYTYADTADNGILIDGSVMFPLFNNTLIPSPLLGELSANGCHVGQGGGGPHCHSDGYQSGATLGLYNDSDYLGANHPPLIGFGYDGIALFGRYRSGDASLLGFGTELDQFGGHNHDGLGYHYHAHTTVYQPESYEPANFQQTLRVLMKGAYIGNTNAIPCFRANSNFSNNKYLGGTPTTSGGCAQ